MTKKIIDLSVALETGIISDPPMALPKIETPRYELTLPSQDIKVQFRPFLVKEEKILLLQI